jgi:hypothetical protein
MSVTSEGYGRHLFEYRYGNSEWGIEITAKSPQEARERLNALTWARYKGEIAATIPVPGARWIKRIIALFRS